MALLTRQALLLASLTPKAIEKRASFEGNAGRYFSRRQVAALKAWVMPDPTLQARLLARANRINPLFARSLERRLVPAAEAAQARWPVKTGLSRAMLTFEFVERGQDKIGVRWANPVPYANLIDAGNVADELVFEPGHRAAVTIADDLRKGV